MKRDEAINRILGKSSRNIKETPVTRENIIIIMDLLFGKEREMTQEDVVKFFHNKGVKVSSSSVSKIVVALKNMGFKLGFLVNHKNKDKQELDLPGMTWGKFKVMPNGDPIPKEFLR